MNTKQKKKVLIIAVPIQILIIFELIQSFSNNNVKNTTLIASGLALIFIICDIKTYISLKNKSSGGKTPENYIDDDFDEDDFDEDDFDEDDNPFQL